MSALTEDVAVARIQPDSPALVRGVVAATVLLAGASFAAGVPGLLAVAGWAELQGALRATVPLMLDGGLLICGSVATVQRARQEPARFAWLVLALLTAASVAAQVAHVVASSGRPQWQVYAGAALAAAFPLLVFASTHMMLSVAVAPAPKRRARIAAARRPAPVTASVATQPTPATAPTPSPLPSRLAPARERAARPVTDRGALADQVRALAAEGLSQREIAEQAGTSKSSVARILQSDQGGALLPV